MTEPSRLLDAAARGPIVLDAGMGTRLIVRGLSIADDDPCLWNLSHPEFVAEVHALDVAAGADALLTNTFGANSHWLSHLGRSADTVTVNRRAAEIAREAAGPSRFVIGSIGPTAAGVYREQAEALAEAGVDALVFELHRFDDVVNALKVVRPIVPVPLIACVVVWIEPVEDQVKILEDLGASAIGENCQIGMTAALNVVNRLRPSALLPLWVKPSGGRPGEPNQTPDSFAAAVPALLRSGVRFLGGCCGTTEAHVAALRAACYAVRGRQTGTERVPSRGEEG